MQSFSCTLKLEAGVRLPRCSAGEALQAPEKTSNCFCKCLSFSPDEKGSVSLGFHVAFAADPNDQELYTANTFLVSCFTLLFDENSDVWSQVN